MNKVIIGLCLFFSMSLFAQDFDPGRLCYAAANCQLGVVKSIIKIVESRAAEKSLYTDSANRKKDVSDYTAEYINAKDENGYTALMYAVANGCFEVSKYLVEQYTLLKATVDNSAAYLPWYERKMILSSGLEVTPEEIKAINEYFVGYSKLIVNAVSDNGLTAVMIAALKHHPTIMSYLFEQGASKNKDGLTKSLWLAVMNDNGNHNEYDVEGNTRPRADIRFFGLGMPKKPVSKADQNYLDTVKYLVEYGADITSRNDDGDTILMRLASGKHYEIVKYLVEKIEEKEGKEFRVAYLKSKNRDGKNALDLAIKALKQKVKEFIGSELDAYNYFTYINNNILVSYLKKKMML